MDHESVLKKSSPSDRLITKEADIAAPIETVFGVIENIELFVQLEENVRKVTITSAVQRGLGMKSHWELQDPSDGSAWYVDEEIVHYDKPHRIGYRGENAEGKSYAGVHTLSARGDGGTHLVFNEVFHFVVDDSIEDIVGGMVANVKKESERVAGGGR
jgi:uncharacterized protein YndB with AHSA1/START domain